LVNFTTETGNSSANISLFYFEATRPETQLTYTFGQEDITSAEWDFTKSQQVNYTITALTDNSGLVKASTSTLEISLAELRVKLQQLNASLQHKHYGVLSHWAVSTLPDQACPNRHL
jgi:hypothetical protein